MNIKILVEFAVVHRMPTVVASDCHIFDYRNNCPGSFFIQGFIQQYKPCLK